MEPGTLSRHELDELYGATLTAALDSGLCVLGGPGRGEVVPSEVYRRLAADLVANQCTVVADLSGELLAAVIAGGASVIKVSHEELLCDGRTTAESREALLDAIAQIAGETGGAVVCSRAGQPAVAVVNGRALEVSSPPLEPVESRGAGDSFTAGLVAGIARGLSFEVAFAAGFGRSRSSPVMAA